MFKNTKEALNKIVNDINFIKWLCTYGLNVLMIIYYVYTIITNKGNLIVSVILISITVLLMIVNLVFTDKKTNNKKLKRKEKIKIKKAKKTSRHILNVIKIITNAYSLGVT